MTRLHTIREVSERTRVPVDTLRYWRHLGTGPESAKLGRRIVYRESDVDAFVAAQFTGQPRHADPQLA